MLSLLISISYILLFLFFFFLFLFFFFFNDTATTEIYTLSLHDALPISSTLSRCTSLLVFSGAFAGSASSSTVKPSRRSEEHTSELQSRGHLVCRLLLEKKKKKKKKNNTKQKNIIIAILMIIVS